MLDSKRRSFSVLEIVITILIISILIIFITPKLQNILEKNSTAILKSNYSLIQNGIVKLKNSDTLLQKNYNISSLDNARVNIENENLFDKVLNVPIKSTSTSLKKSGNWAKVSNIEYIFFTNQKEYIFKIIDSNFECISNLDLCKDLQ